jgi:hypothetical protein
MRRKRLCRSALQRKIVKLARVFLVLQCAGVRRAPHKSPPTPLPGWITPELIAETRTVWRPYYPEDLTDEQAVALLLPVGVLYEVLSPDDTDRDTDDEEERADADGEEVHRPGPRQ